MREYHKLYARRWRAAHHAQYLENARRWNAAHPDQLKKNYEREKAKLYGLSVGVMKALLSFPCAICRTTEGRMQIDHCHATGKVRGTLCALCNRGLGMFKDDPQILLQAARYVEV